MSDQRRLSYGTFQKYRRKPDNRWSVLWVETCYEYSQCVPRPLVTQIDCPFSDWSELAGLNQSGAITEMR